MSTVYVGDTYPFTVRLKVGGTAFALTAGVDTVSGVWIDPETGLTICNAATMSSATTGADWTNGIVAVAFSAVESAKLSAVAGKTAILELQVTKTAGIQTFQASYGVKTGVLP